METRWFCILETQDIGLETAEKEFQLAALMRKLTSPATDGKPLDLSQVYFPGETATLASADLQEYVGRSIAKASGKVIETAVLEFEGVAADASDRRIGIKASFDIGNDGLLALLHELETGLPLVFVDKLAIRPMPAGDGKGADALRIDLEAVARWRSPSR